jgi:SAM-dependent methyltransferase
VCANGTRLDSRHAEAELGGAYVLQRIGRIGLSAASTTWKLANDRWLNIDTVSPPLQLKADSTPIESAFHDNYPYASLDYWDLRRIVVRVAPTHHDVVYDLGCGLGRVVCLFARHPVKKVVGVEINPLFHGRLLDNAQRLRGRRSVIEIRNEDATRTAIGDGTVFVFVNPFGPETLESVLDRMRDSTHKYPRSIRLVYVNPLAGHRDLFAKQQWLRTDPAMRTLHGLDILFFRNSWKTPAEHE